jgi:hypothetical protein
MPSCGVELLAVYGDFPIAKISDGPQLSINARPRASISTLQHSTLQQVQLKEHTGC